jgi:hypothetical protein
MAGKSKSWYVSVMDQIAKKTVEHKQFFDIGAANAFIKSIEEKYPKPQYTIYKETY